MFFITSKIFWVLVQPLSLIVLLSVFALLLLWFKRGRIGGFLLTVAVLIGLFSSFTTLGALLIAPLEDRFARPAALPTDVRAIVVLGGGFNGKVSLRRGVAELRAAGDRFVEAIALALRYPGAKVVISVRGAKVVAVRVALGSGR